MPKFKNQKNISHNSQWTQILYKNWPLTLYRIEQTQLSSTHARHCQEGLDKSVILKNKKHFKSSSNNIKIFNCSLTMYRYKSFLIHYLYSLIYAVQFLYEVAVQFLYEVKLFCKHDYKHDCKHNCMNEIRTWQSGFVTV